MAAKRCIPTDLFYNRKFVRLRSDTFRLILIGLITDADDAGRGLADPDLLGRKLDQRPENIQEALEDLEQAGFVQHYTQGEESYYFLCHWYEWEKLGKPTPSRYPAPPQTASHELPQDSPWVPRGTRNAPNVPEDSNSEEEGEEKRKESEDEEKGHATLKSQHRRVLPFPAFHPASDAAQVARILKLPVTDALTRLIEEYASVSSLSLLGEADAAREWMDDPRRNRKKQRMTPAFFRRWLKRELEAQEHRHLSLQQATLATGTTGGAHPLQDTSPVPGHRSPNLMHLAEEDAQAKGRTH